MLDKLMSIWNMTSVSTLLSLSPMVPAVVFAEELVVRDSDARAVTIEKQKVEVELRRVKSENVRIETQAKRIEKQQKELEQKIVVLQKTVETTRTSAEQAPRPVSMGSYSSSGSNNDAMERMEREQREANERAERDRREAAYQNCESQRKSCQANCAAMPEKRIVGKDWLGGDKYEYPRQSCSSRCPSYCSRF